MRFYIVLRSLLSWVFEELTAVYVTKAAALVRLGISERYLTSDQIKCALKTILSQPLYLHIATTPYFH